MTDPNSTRRPESPAPEALQFDQVDAPTSASETAASGSVKCAVCGNAIEKYYYDVAGQSVCATCQQLVAQNNEPARGAGTFFKSFLLGGLAAVVGAAIYYAVIAITDFEIGLVAILIGFLVGAAIRKGTGGRGGRKYQVIAVLMTYFAVGLAYTPLAIKGAMEGSPSDSAKAADSVASSRDAAAPIAPTVPSAADSSSAVTLAGTTSGTAVADSEQVTAAGALLGLGLVLVGGFLMAFALPVIAVIGSMPSGLISALIIAFGMHQAWKMTAAHVVPITGPYRVGEDRSGAPADAPTPTA